MDASPERLSALRHYLILLWSISHFGIKCTLISAAQVSQSRLLRGELNNDAKTDMGEGKLTGPAVFTEQAKVNVINTNVFRKCN